MILNGYAYSKINSGELIPQRGAEMEQIFLYATKSITWLMVAIEKGLDRKY